MIYNAVYNHNDVKNHHDYCVKYVKDYPKKNYYETVKKRRSIIRKRRNMKQQNISTYLVRLLLLCGDVELNPGPVMCATCNQTFNRPSRLANYQRSAVPSPCEVCGVVFCHKVRKQQHVLREHSGHGITTPPTTSNDPIDLNVSILGNTTYQNREGYRNKIDEHRSMIRSHTIESETGKRSTKSCQ